MPRASADVEGVADRADRPFVPAGRAGTDSGRLAPRDDPPARTVDRLAVRDGESDPGAYRPGEREW